MIGMMIESIVVAFVVGGVLGAVTALHLSAPKKSAIVIKEKDSIGKKARH